MTGLHTKLSFYIKKQHTYYHKKKSCIFSLKKRNYNLFKENCQWLVIMYLTILKNSNDWWMAIRIEFFQWVVWSNEKLTSYHTENKTKWREQSLCCASTYYYKKIEYKKWKRTEWAARAIWHVPILFQWKSFSNSIYDWVLILTHWTWSVTAQCSNEKKRNGW